MIRADLSGACHRAWQRLGDPGTWWPAVARVAIAAETRNAHRCDLCRRRKEALSPYAIEGDHDSLGTLPVGAVEVIHRVVTDPARLTRQWFDGVIAGGLSDAEYVELVSIVAHVVAIDTFARGLGIAPYSIPEPRAGRPSRRRPSGAKDNGSWVATILPGDHGPEEADLFEGRGSSNIRRALSLVPHEMRSFFDVIASQYLPGPAMFDFENEYRAITHPQIELLASRVAALNECFY